MWVSPPEVTPMIIDHYNKVFDLPGVSTDACASVIGKIRNDGQYIVHNGNDEIVNAPAEEVTGGFLYNRPFEPRDRKFTEPVVPELSDYNQTLLDILSHENMASREPVFEQYDKQVQGRTYTETGLADSGVMAPFNSENYPKEIRNIGIALSTDHNPRYGLIDPYWGGVNAVVEAMRNVAAVGATPHAITDCLCFGNPEKPHQMWEFVESVRGVADACHAITLKDNPDDATPIIAGNVSFYNESKTGAIPPSPIVSCLGRIKDVNKAVPMHFQQTDSVILMIGERKDELGGSMYYNLYGELGAHVPQPDLEEVKKQIFALTDCIDDGIVFSCHDIADGGVVSAIAEMTFGNGIGCDVNVSSDLPNDKILFSETGGFILEVSMGNMHFVQRLFSDRSIPVYDIGVTTPQQFLKMNELIMLPISKARDAWKNGLREKL
jgi:phosphoribosylformylglycinamidine synthase